MVTWCTGRPSARGDHQHALEDRLVVELERVGGDGHFRLGPPPGDPGLKVSLDRRDAFQGQGARHRDDDVADDLGAAGPEPDRLDPRHAPGVDDQAADRVGQPLGSAVDERVDRRPAQAIACDGDEAGDADRRQRIGMGVSGPRGRESEEDEHRGNEIARIMQRVGAQRMA